MDREVRNLLSGAHRPIVISHERPDGDAIGSLLGLTTVLLDAGKDATPVLHDGLPGRYQFLPHAPRVQSTLPPDADLLVCLDCSDLARTGFSADDLPRFPDLNIDHHPTNTRFAKVNLVEVEAAATSEMLAKGLPEWGFELTPQVATCLLTGLVTDTIGFRTTSTTPETFRTAADLLAHSVDLPAIYQKTLTEMSLAAARYWGQGLRKLTLEGRILWTSLTLEDRKEAGYSAPDDADLVSVMTTIEAAEVVVIFVEQSGGRVKVSWRARPGFNVAAVASSFGGGGHEPAAGAMVEGDLEDVQEQVLNATRALLEDAAQDSR